MSSLTTDKSETEPGAFKDNNTSQPSALHSTIERLKTYIYQIGKVSHNVGEETPILGGMARDFCRNVRSLVKPKERYLDEEIISEIITDLVTMLRKIPHNEKFAFSTALAFGNIDKQAGKSEEPAANIAHLFDILNCLLIPTENLITFVGSLKEKKPVCGRVFLDGDLAYTCLDCRTDATCIICEECFNNSNHVGHRVRYHRTSAGGICDCGDAEAWKPEGFCDQHCGLGNNQKTTSEIFGHKVEDDSRLPEQFQRACEIIVNFVVKYLTIYSMQDYGSFSIFPESPKIAPKILNGLYVFIMTINTPIKMLLRRRQIPFL